MKILLLCMALILCLTGCAGNPAAATTTASPTATAETTAAVEETIAATPINTEKSEQVEDAAAVEAALGLIMKLPGKAEALQWYVDQDGQAAYVSFIFEGTTYWWMMGTKLPEAKFDEKEYPQVNRTNWMDYPYTVYSNDQGAGHVLWEDTLQKASCHLFALDGTDAEKLAELAVLLLPAA